MAVAAFLSALSVPNAFHRSIVQGAIAAIYIISEAHVDAKAAAPPSQGEAETNAVGFQYDPPPETAEDSVSGY